MVEKSTFREIRMEKKAKATIKKVIKGLTKASKTHAGQAKSLSKVVKKKSRK
tara:strand:+ start:246 stop:401 length:156 start_codon:yes stop_codon:yes gene_type:complete